MIKSAASDTKRYQIFVEVRSAHHKDRRELSKRAS
jgi:hypothetical protein